MTAHLDGIIALDAYAALRSRNRPFVESQARIVHGALRAMGLAAYVGRTFALVVRGERFTVIERDGEWAHDRGA